MMRLRKYVSLIGALGVLFVLSSPVEAGWLDKLNDWIDNINKPKNFSRQYRFYSVENCIKYYEKGDFKQALSYCGSAAEINKETIYYAAELEYKYGNKELAFNYLKGAEKYLLERLEAGKGDEQEKIRDKKRLANVCFWLGEIYNKLYQQEGEKIFNFDVDKYQELKKTMIEYYKKALSLGEESDEKIVVAKAGAELGSFYLRWVVYNYSLLNNATEVLEKALKAIEEVKETQDFTKKDIQETKGWIYNLVGVIYYRKKDYKNAEEYYLKALALAEKLNSVQTQVYKHDLAILYKDMKDYDKYEKYLKEAIEDGWRRGKGDLEKMAEWSEELGEFYLEHKNDKKRAKEYFISAIELYEDLMRRTKNKFKWREYDRQRNELFKKIKKLDT
jgi:tetratricopeptide (TPR) repeat protein